MNCKKCGKSMGLFRGFSSDRTCDSCRNAEESRREEKGNPLMELFEILQKASNDPDSNIKVASFTVDGSNPEGLEELMKIIAKAKGMEHMREVAVAFANAVHGLLHAGYRLEDMTQEIRALVEAETRFAIKFLRLENTPVPFEEIVERSLDEFYESFSECNHGRN